MQRPNDPSSSSPPLFHWFGRSELPILIGEDCLPHLPEVILWAFRLGEGDLLTVSPDVIKESRYRFESYSQAVRFLGEAISAPWPYLEELLLLQMAALGPQGRLYLPEETVHLSGRPGERLRFSVEPRPFQEGFTLEPALDVISTHLCLEIRYVLQVDKGYIRVPADLRLIAGLDDQWLAYETRMGMADFTVFRPGEPLGGLDLTCLGSEGSLLLPKAFLDDLKEDWQVLLSARISPEPSFRLTYYLGGQLARTSLPS